MAESRLKKRAAMFGGSCTPGALHDFSLRLQAASLERQRHHSLRKHEPRHRWTAALHQILGNCYTSNSKFSRKTSYQVVVVAAPPLLHECRSLRFIHQVAYMSISEAQAAQISLASLVNKRGRVVSASTQAIQNAMDSTINQFSDR